MTTSKIRLLKQLPETVLKHKKKGKRIGLITGCFDILHIGHVDLFRNSKNEVDVLIVGVENDQTIKLSKGTNRPVNTQEIRMKFLESIKYIDYIFSIDEIFEYHDSRKANKIHSYILKTINPDFIITTKQADKYWKNKKITRLLKSWNIC